MELIELLNGLIMVSYLLPFYRRDMEVNEGKNWMKNKMRKRLKINLPLDAPSWLFKRVLGMLLMAMFE